MSLQNENAQHDPYAVLKIKEFRLFILARFFITLAIQIQAVVVAWQVYEFTHDPLSLGLIGLAEAIPSITVALYAGHIADTISRKKIILAAICILFFCSFSLFIFTINFYPFLDLWGVVPIYSVIFISGIARGFLNPATFSFMPQLVTKSLYSNAVTWNSTIWQTAAVTGPAIGGLVYGFFGISFSYVLDGLLVLLAIILYAFIGSKPIPINNIEQNIKEKLLAGLKFVFNHQIILSALSLDLFAVLFGGAVALLPIFAADVLHIGPEGLGLLRSAQAVGALTMAVFITYNPVVKDTGKKLLFSVGGFGICMILFALSKNFWLSWALLALSGMFDMVSVIIRGTLIHTLTPENMKGRVSAVNSIFIGSSNEIGAFESGLAARLLRVIPSVIFGGCMTLLVVSVTGWKADKLRKLHME